MFVNLGIISENLFSDVQKDFCHKWPFIKFSVNMGKFFITDVVLSVRNTQAYEVSQFLKTYTDAFPRLKTIGHVWRHWAKVKIFIVIPFLLKFHTFFLSVFAFFPVWFIFGTFIIFFSLFLFFDNFAHFFVLKVCDLAFFYLRSATWIIFKMVVCHRTPSI